MSICPIPATSRRPRVSRVGYNSYQIFLCGHDGKAYAVTPEMAYSTAMGLLKEARHADALIAMGWEYIDARKEAYMNAHGSLRDRISRSAAKRAAKGGAASTFRFVKLDHREFVRASEGLSLSEKDELLRVFCAARGLPFISADDLLAEMLGEELASTEVINWLSDYVDAYMNHREHP